MLGHALSDGLQDVDTHIQVFWGLVVPGELQVIGLLEFNEQFVVPGVRAWRSRRPALGGG